MSMKVIHRNHPIDVIVAGAGVWGCTVARRLADMGRRVLVLEKRKAIGGNCRCRHENGIEVHLYGSHIFHTANEEVWQFVNRFCSFNGYRHSVLANHKDRIFHLPIGCTLLREFFGRDLKPSALTDEERATIPLIPPSENPIWQSTSPRGALSN